MHPFDKNLFRTGARLNISRDALDSLWTELADHAPAGALAWREAAALVAAARWSIASADRRNESRGMHRREDFPGPKAELAVRLLSGGLDRVWIAADGESPGTRSSQLEPAL
jgi:succinate dehydrogenase/fumarate reductase flavoprotein subunit